MVPDVKVVETDEDRIEVNVGYGDGRVSITPNKAIQLAQELFNFIS